MDISLHISDGSSTTTLTPASPNQSPDSMPLDAGASPALEAGADTDSDLVTHDRAQALDAGAPPASLLEEVEAALRGNENTTAHAAVSTGDGVSAGAAPA